MLSSIAKCGGACAVAACLNVFPAFAQAPPQAGTILKEIERSEPKPPPSERTLLVVPKEMLELQESKAKVLVRDFRVTGATLVPDEDLKEEVKDLIGSELTLSELRRAALRVSDVYRRNGLFARALIPQQRVQNGVVEIAVIEGRLSAIEAEALPGTRLSPERARGYVQAHQRLGDPLHPQEVQNGLRNLNEVPGVTAMGVLQPGEREGDVKLNLRMDPTPLLNASLYLDNYGMRAIGRSRAVGYGQINSPTGYGDQATVLAVGTTGSDYLRGGYSIPIGYDGLRVTATAARLMYRAIKNSLGINGYANIGGISLAQPLRRTASSNLFGSLGYEKKHFVNDSVVGNINDKTTDTYALSAYGDFLDALYGGRNSFNLSLINGKLELGRNPTDLGFDAAGARTQGSYSKLAWLYSRLQKVTETDDFYVGFSGQQATKNLDPSEKLSLGGANGVRAYPTGEALGDQGWIANVEWRRALRNDLQGTAFLDAGQIKTSHDAFGGGGSIPPRYDLYGVGLGLQYTQANSFAVRSSMAWKLGTNPGAVNGADIEGGRVIVRAWIQLILFM